MNRTTAFLLLVHKDEAGDVVQLQVALDHPTLVSDSKLFEGDQALARRRVTRRDLTGWFWAGLIERISSNQRSPECPEVESSAPSRLWGRCVRLRCSWRKA